MVSNGRVWFATEWYLPFPQNSYAYLIVGLIKTFPYEVYKGIFWFWFWVFWGCTD